MMKKTLVLLAVLMLIGGICYLLQLIFGASLTNMNNFVPWGLYIIGFMIFTGLAAGSLIFAGSAWLFAPFKAYQPYTKIITFLGVFGGLIGAGAFIFVDLGNPQRGIYMLLSPNLTSPQVWDGAVLSSFGLVGALLLWWLWQVARGKVSASAMRLPAILAVAAGLLVLVTSFAFVLLVSSPAWNNPGEPLSFLMAALIATAAIFMLVLQYLQSIAYIQLPDNLLSRLGAVAAVCLLVELIFSISEVCIGLYAPHGEEAAVVFWQLFGKGAAFYWAEMLCIVLGIVTLMRFHGQRGLKIGACLALLAVFLIKYNLLQSQQLNPLLPFAGPSAYNPPALGVYIPSLVEIGTAVGVIAAVCAVGIVGLAKFKKFFTVTVEE